MSINLNDILLMHTIFLKRTNSEDPDFRALVGQLDAELAIIDGDDHTFYNQFNKIDHLGQVVVAYEKDRAVGCGAIKLMDAQIMEVKRMFVFPGQRGKGVASKVLAELERWAFELNARACCLETGIKQHDAIALYRKNGYGTIPNYGQYAGVANSVCFRKSLIGGESLDTTSAPTPQRFKRHNSARPPGE